MKYILLLILASLGIMLSLSLYSRKTPENLGINDGRVSDCPQSDNCVSSEASGESHHISPLTIKGSTVDVVNLLRQVIEDMGGTVVETTGGYIHAEFTSSFWHFKDDLECLYNEKDGEVQIRSASRVGHFDFNANRNRVELLRRNVDTLKINDL